MALKAILDTLDGVDEPFKTLYTEREGKYLLTGIEGVKTDADVTRVQRALEAERNAHKTVKTALESYASLGALEELQAKLDKFPELEAAAQGKLNDEQINQIVEGRIKSKLSPIERQLQAAQKEAGDFKTLAEQLQGQIKGRTIADAVGGAARELKVLNEAHEDVLLYGERLFEVDSEGKVVTKDGVGVTPGLSPKEWLQDIQSKRPHWWPASQGGGAAGSGGAGGFANNPFSAEHWNMTEQGAIMRADPAKAARMAQAAGTTVGGPKPAAKK